jgi:RNase P subunit RPR2
MKNLFISKTHNDSNVLKKITITKKKNLSNIRQNTKCAISYVYSISEKKKRFIHGKCKAFLRNGINSTVHIVSKYFNTILLVKFPIFSPKCIDIKQFDNSN